VRAPRGAATLVAQDAAPMIATAPGKLIVTGEYAVLDGAPAIVVAVDRRAVARRNATPRGSSPFLLAVADEIAARRGASDPAAHAALEISVDSTAFYDQSAARRLGAITLPRGSITAQRAAVDPAIAPPATIGLDSTKLGLGSSAAVTVAATALALGTVDRHEVLEVALAAHARAQGPRGARGSGADIAASVHGGTLVFSRSTSTAPCHIERRRWPSAVAIAPFFTGAAADTAQLVARVTAARDANRTAVDAALAAIADASRAACAALAAPPDVAPVALIGALALAANATDRLAIATAIDLVPTCVTQARAQLARLGGTAKTTGAGGGDVGIAVFPATVDATVVTRLLIEAGCQPLRISLDETGVDLRADAS
jgi:phosphomevalonate kinase